MAMKTLVVSYSFTGNNLKLANHLKKRLDCDVVSVETVRKTNGLSVFLDIFLNRRPSLKPLRANHGDYDHIIFTAPIWAGKVAMPMQAFIEKEAKAIKNYSFISICGGGNNGQKELVRGQLLAATGRLPESITEIWVKKITDSRKDSPAMVSKVRVEEGNFEIFQEELNSFIEGVLRVEETRIRSGN